MYITKNNYSEQMMMNQFYLEYKSPLKLIQAC